MRRTTFLPLCTPGAPRNFLMPLISRETGWSARRPVSTTSPTRRLRMSKRLSGVSARIPPISTCAFLMLSRIRWVPSRSRSLEVLNQFDCENSGMIGSITLKGMQRLSIPECSAISTSNESNTTGSFGATIWRRNGFDSVS